MQVKCRDMINGNDPTQELTELVQSVLEDDFNDGRIEKLEGRLNKVVEMMGKLIDALAKKEVLKPEDLNSILQNYKYENIRLIEPSEIHYLVGDATEPIGEGKKIICHVCNDEGKWGSGFVLAVSKKWKRPEKEYRNPIADLELGDAQFVQVEDDIWVANMVAQHSVRSTDNPAPIKYNALRSALEKVAEFAGEMHASVHGPRFGAGLAGGSWKKIEYIISETLTREGIPVFIYDLPEKAGE